MKALSIKKDKYKGSYEVNFIEILFCSCWMSSMIDFLLPMTLYIIRLEGTEKIAVGATWISLRT